MHAFIFLAALALFSSPCSGRAIESVVSDYTNSTAGQPGVYSQIATNIAEKITSPFYRFFGINNSEHKPTERPFQHIELLDNTTRDVEELSEEALRREEKKPEKVSLFSYLPPNVPEGVTLFSNYIGKLELNETNEVDDFDDEFSLDDVGVEPRGPFVYVLELLGSVIQLLWGGFLAIFNPPNHEK